MKIIRKGSTARVKYRFSCSVCGCIWDAEPEEYFWSAEKGCMCICPTCTYPAYHGEPTYLHLKEE